MFYINYNNLFYMKNNFTQDLNSSTIDQESIISWFLFWSKSYEKLLRDINKLERIEDTLVVSDFDDTLFSRSEQLKNPMLAQNRWESWNKVIRELLWGYEAFVEKYYEVDWLTSEIVEMVRKNVSIILTAWIQELQELKINKVLLWDIPKVIVPENSLKSFALLNYILTTWKIPSQIDIYDDRVEHLCSNAYLLEQILWTKINIFEVKLDWNKLDSLRKCSFK